MWNLKNETNEYNKAETDLTDIENKVMNASGEREGGKGKIGVGN